MNRTGPYSLRSSHPLIRVLELSGAKRQIGLGTQAQLSAQWSRDCAAKSNVGSKTVESCMVPERDPPRVKDVPILHPVQLQPIPEESLHGR
jgi:hypothetical protein